MSSIFRFLKTMLVSLTNPVIFIHTLVTRFIRYVSIFRFPKILVFAMLVSLANPLIFFHTLVTRFIRYVSRGFRPDIDASVASIETSDTITVGGHPLIQMNKSLLFVDIKLAQPIKL